jgi:hydroxyethylthiazole kinase-like uncharacterized protein yjeF
MAPDTSPGVQPIGIENALERWPLAAPDGDGDKEVRGRVVLVAGSREIPGAAVLAATAALRAAAGRVTIAAPVSIAQSIAFAVPDSRVIALTETKSGGIAARAIDALDPFVDRTRALLVGPGLPYDDASAELAAALLPRFAKASIILDAAAMGIVRMKALRFRVPVLMTPHCGEMASLTSTPKEAIEAAPAQAAHRAARTWNAVVALKGAVTYLAADAGVWRHEGGNAGLATSGSGDVLAGIIAGLAARGMPLEGAAAWGVALHARAGERLAQRLGPLGYLARELAGEIPALMAVGSSSRA